MKKVAFIIPAHINPNVKFGGVLQLYLLAKCLTDHSSIFDGKVLRLGPELTWLDPNLKKLEESDATLHGYDSVVIPEVIPQATWWWLGVPNHYLYAQAFAEEYVKVPLNRLSNKAYWDLGYTGVFAVSPFVAHKLDEYRLWDKEIPVIPNIFTKEWLDTVGEVRKHTRRHQAKVLFVDRKGCEVFNDVLIKKISSDKTRDWEVSRISNATERDVIKEMASSKCVVLNYREEGFYRMALETILCGCVPIVYPAGGGEYFLAHRRNSLIVDDYDDIAKYWYYIKYVTSSNFYDDLPSLDFSVTIPHTEEAVCKILEESLIKKANANA